MVGLVLSWLLAAAAPAHDYTLGPLTIGHPWARATAGGMTTGVVYVTFVNDGRRDDRLLKASTPVAAEAMLHNNLRDGDVVRMRMVDQVALPAGSTTEFKPGGLHIMLMGLKQPLKQGDMFPLTLSLANEGEITVDVMVADGN